MPMILPAVLAASNVMTMQDGEVRKQFERSLKKQGFNFKLNTKVERLYAYLLYFRCRLSSYRVYLILCAGLPI